MSNAFLKMLLPVHRRKLASCRSHASPTLTPHLQSGQQETGSSSWPGNPNYNTFHQPGGWQQRLLQKPKSKAARSITSRHGRGSGGMSEKSGWNCWFHQRVDMEAGTSHARLSTPARHSHPLHVFTQLQVLTCALRFHWKCGSLWDSQCRVSKCVCNLLRMVGSAVLPEWHWKVCREWNIKQWRLRGITWDADARSGKDRKAIFQQLLTHFLRTGLSTQTYYAVSRCHFKSNENVLVHCEYRSYSLRPYQMQKLTFTALS